MKYLIALLVLPAAGLLTWGLISLVMRERQRHLHETLAPYSVGTLREAGVATATTGGTPELMKTPFLQRAVATVAELATRRGILQYLKRLLDQADLPLRPAEALFVYLVGVVVGGALGLLLGNAIWGLIALGLVAVVPWMALMAAAKRRTALFTAQLPDMLQLLGTTLRSGFSILQGLTTVSQQLSDPIGKEMRHVVAEARLGRSLVDALSEVAQRVRSDDFEWVVTAIGIQREVGGNLAELLDIVADTMIARARIRGEAKTLTAEGRIGAAVISILPIAIGFFVYAVNPSYISPLFHQAFGEILFYGSIGLGVIGIYWTRKLVDIEV
ncbi:MAG TPA: type II secretion system F family protein [Acidimicrobiales bacterium]|nr:type II secretion system F family protein [Acidimicrobiales bacterium]